MGFLSNLFGIRKSDSASKEEQPSDKPHEYTRKEIYDLAVQSIKKQYPSRYDHVIVLSPGEFQDETYTYYESKTKIATQEGHVIWFPYVRNASSIIERALKADGKRIMMSEIRDQLRNDSLKVNKSGCRFDTINLQISEEDVKNIQEDFILTEQTKVCRCEDCRGTGYQRCPDEECRGRHEYKCPRCNGKGETTCKTCNGNKKLTCPDCKGKGELTCSNCKGEGTFVCRECKGRGDVKCKKCNGQGKVRCKACYGSGKNNSGGRCTSCYGSGYITCENCAGRGTYVCPTCKGRRTLTCTTCGGDGKVVCRKCGGRKEITCSNCGGNGVITCKHCYGDGVVICKTCLGDKEHYGMIECPECGASGKIGQIGYVETKIEQLSNKQSPEVRNKREHLNLEKVLNDNKDLQLIYKNINGKTYKTKDAKALEIALKIDEENCLSKSSDNPRIVRQELFYRDIYCVSINCQHILSKKQFCITVVDVFGNPVVLFPDYDSYKKLSTGLFEGLGYAIAGLVQTKKHKHRMDCFCTYKLVLGLAQADGVMDDNEKRLLIDKLTEFDLLTPRQKNSLWERLNSSTPYELNKEDVRFSSLEKATEVLSTLRKLSEIDGAATEPEINYINAVDSLIKSMKY